MVRQTMRSRMVYKKIDRVDTIYYGIRKQQ